MRDTALLLDITHGRLPGEVYQIAPPTRRFLAEIGVDPGRLRIAMVLDTPDGGTPLDPRIRQAAIDNGELLESQAHHVEPQPVPCAYGPLMKPYTNIMDTKEATGVSGLRA